jgi:hypothetical protein
MLHKNIFSIEPCDQSYKIFLNRNMSISIIKDNFHWNENSNFLNFLQVSNFNLNFQFGVNKLGQY